LPGFTVRRTGAPNVPSRACSRGRGRSRSPCPARPLRTR
jgi:hypothetical protein